MSQLVTHAAQASLPTPPGNISGIQTRGQDAVRVLERSASLLYSSPHAECHDLTPSKSLAQPGFRVGEAVVSGGFNKKLAIKVKAFRECRPGVPEFILFYLPLLSFIKVEEWLYSMYALL